MKKLFRSGEPFIWLTGGALGGSLIMILGLILLIAVNGLGFFWPSDVALLTLADGSKAMGQIWNREAIPTPGEAERSVEHRLQIHVGNRELYGQDFRWIDEARIERREWPEQTVLLERREWGSFYGFIREVRTEGRAVAQGSSDEAWNAMLPLLDRARALWNEVRALEKGPMGEIYRRQERNRLAVRRVRLRHGSEEEIQRLLKESEAWGDKYRRVSEEIGRLRSEMNRSAVILETAQGETKEIPLSMIVRAIRPNALGVLGKCRVYAQRLWEFASGDPRESNTEGGIFPAIFGTVMMVFIMTLAVVPLGVLAALYLREYAKQGLLVRIVRIAVNNLAGVPSIVFGVFGLGFFIYLIGGSIDRLFFPEALPTPTYGTGGILWASLTLALLTVPVVIVATEEGLAAVPAELRQGSLALGATKFETLRRIVLPSATPGILTGMILAMARAAGEVAPLMITGVVKLAPTLPVDGTFPYLHLERKFMHLGFHIYDVGFQSPNVEAARPMVYATTLLLLVIVVGLNLAAIGLRNRLRRKYHSTAF
ncbi:MAG: phosphate ABC transporter permease PstA [Planctomycetes bacterium]|nr:phosphate ABC transporter permease PstA [Planctomycetota bacterium]